MIHTTYQADPSSISQAISKTLQQCPYFSILPALSLLIFLASQYFLTVTGHLEGLVDTIFWQQRRVMMMAINNSLLF